MYHATEKSFIPIFALIYHKNLFHINRKYRYMSEQVVDVARQQYEACTAILLAAQCPQVDHRKRKCSVCTAAVRQSCGSRTNCKTVARLFQRNCKTFLRLANLVRAFWPGATESRDRRSDRIQFHTESQTVSQPYDARTISSCHMQGCRKTVMQNLQDCRKTKRYVAVWSLCDLQLQSYVSQHSCDSLAIKHTVIF